MTTQTTATTGPAAAPGGQTTAPAPWADVWCRASTPLPVGRIHPPHNPLLREPLGTEHVEPRLLGHRGTTGGDHA